LKKSKIATLCILSLLAIAFAGKAAAYNSSFTHTDYQGTNAPTIDGQYTGGSAEYSAAAAVGFGTDAVYRAFWVIVTNVQEFMIIETMDTTNDPNDYYVICYDSAADGTGQNPPQTDDFKIVITGHGTSATQQWYRGTGTTWSSVAAPATAVFNFKESLATSPTSTTPHYMVEMTVDKQDTATFGISIIGINYAMRVSYNDTNTGSGTVQAWPPSPATDDIPDGWGYMPADISGGTVPEGFSIVIIVALSSIAIVTGSVLLRKHAKTAKQPNPSML
jgi:hypothetical protein